MDIATRLRQLATAQGARIALRCGAAAMSYEALCTSSGLLAQALSRRGIGRGRAFAVLCENSIELLQLYYAAARLGAVLVPLNPSLSAREVAYIADHIESAVLLHDRALEKVAAAALPDGRRAMLSNLFDDLGECAARPAEEDHSARDFLVIYTSGSTGVPKAVVFDQAGEIAGNDSLARLWNIGPDDITLVALPLGFLYGLSTAAATGIQAGGEVVVLPRFHPGGVLKAIVEARITVYHGVPTMFAMMLDYAEQQGLDVDLSPLRLLISAGAPLSEELRNRFESRFGKRIDDYYALSEARPIFGRHWGEAEPPRGAIGKAAPGVEVRIVDGEGGDLGPGEAGEIVVRAPAMLKRYHGEEALTRQAVRNGWFRTGDLGRCDEEGHYFLIGRIKDIIIRGGVNIAPAELEEVLMRHPAVRAAAVIGVGDPTFGEVPVAYVVARLEAPGADELQSFCAGQLPQYKVPTAFVFLPSLPLGLSGKVDKKALSRRWTEARA
ncbi:MAG TPA: class I adenylate-forming enzyme family protein [Aestuariivirgaceae bacterium]|nr:class I adenylate-forming enzyme family protein [Aestuariivirgaceae bacterium]